MHIPALHTVTPPLLLLIWLESLFSAPRLAAACASPRPGYKSGGQGLAAQRRSVRARVSAVELFPP